MTANKKNQEFKIRKIRRNIEYSFRDSDRYFDLFIVFLVAGIVLWAVMHVIFDVCIDSWMADPKLLNFQYMWNVLMKVIPFTLWALASGFFVAGYLLPLCALPVRNIMIFLLKRRMRRENNVREDNNDAAY
ncbi:F-type conjugal transfer protein TrbF [Escherichia coli]|uniref:F-type conjugal transfer protein TrbF n=2 Tax=Escherichia coli TaxID=562 RepID=UPI000CDA8DAD|nr:F-type conjugal transfer protein TrbF [Escherichia coli]EGY0366364.1 F-type conjugal transfer protein TrbF [Escherichia coli]EKE7418363.1 F-type conjugal transfer protein TrbF [Escherichia coli]MCV8076990.1 F-type conjugal transfer protein TrbF [Escherichia coli]HBA5255435.1 F-type conjugal transfer protein TrbF [Escherichia coli]HBA5298470.1 F-type conjugal transfer protein TrbF [Escherichia coli]